jgi:SAM-dependent methyltransferase
VLDVGCGPGQVTRYLHRRGLDASGVDLSPVMVETARTRTPDVRFGVGDMHALEVEDGAVAGILARYSIIHLPRTEVPPVLREFRRALRSGGALLVAVHVGEGEIHVDDFRGSEVAVDATLFGRDELVGHVEEAGFAIASVSQRPPEDDEYRADKLYVLARAS